MNMDQHINVEDICRKQNNFNNVQALNKNINNEKNLNYKYQREFLKTLNSY